MSIGRFRARWPDITNRASNRPLDLRPSRVSGCEKRLSRTPPSAVVSSPADALLPASATTSGATSVTSAGRGQSYLSNSRRT